MTLELKLNAALGQVWTPDDIANNMVKKTFKLMPDAKRVLDPACGPGTFSKAIHQINNKNMLLTCFDVDARMQMITEKTHSALGIQGEVFKQDYLLNTSLENKFDIIIMNPPYIRQEKINNEAKASYHSYLGKKLKEPISKRSNLFSLFLLKAIIDLKPNGILCAIVFDAIKSSSYGKQTLSILNKNAELISCETVKAPFDNVLIDATILLYRKREAPLCIEKQQCKNLTNSLLVSLEELLHTRRGTPLPRRAPFLADPDDEFYKYSVPFFIKQARLKGLVIKPDQRIYVSSPKLEELNGFQPWMKKRLELHGLQEKNKLIRTVNGKIAFNYYIRNAPRHLWNENLTALSDNFYVSETKHDFPNNAAWLLLNSEQYLNRIMKAAKNQGNGLAKLQLYQYKNILLPNWTLFPENDITKMSELSTSLLKKNTSYEEVKKIATNFVKKILDKYEYDT